MNPQFWQGKRVFITGATGLLGSHMTRTLVRSGARVTALILDEPSDSLLVQSPEWQMITKVYGELQDHALLRRVLNTYEIDYVIHLAAQTQVTHANLMPLETLESNIRGTYHLLEACRLHTGLKGIVVASSDKAYGSQPTLPYTEDAPLQGRHPYDVSKSCADLLSQMYHETYKLPICITRCGNLYGAGDLNFIRVIPEAILRVHKKQPLELRSDGTFVRDYFYVEDAVDGYLTIAENMHRQEVVGHAFNLSTGNKLSVLDVVKAVEEVTGERIDVKILNNARGEIKDQYLSSEKAKKVLRWEPKHTLHQGLAKAVPSYLHFLKTGRWL